MPHISTLELNPTVGKFVLEPLERGYGQTIGNALRRVLLSSIYGAAVTAVRIDKVFHEFAAIPGCREDATELLQNLKDLSIRYLGDGMPPEEVVLRIDVKGPGRVTGADIVCPESVQVVNTDCYITTISDSGASLNMELYVGWGTGYVLPQNHEKYRGVIGILATGSQFTPVRRVGYTVEATRVGTRTDYERLVLEVATNGSVLPNDAVTQASIILTKYFRMFEDLGRRGMELDFEEEEDLAPELANVPELKIEEMDFSQRTFNCLRRAGLLTLRHLAIATETDLTSIRGFGKKSLTEVRDKLAEHGLTIRPPKGGYRAVDLLDDEDEDFD
ncbi:MAG TPA: DNA-directed RNA polymerase subunit alpha [Fimbriimonadaceae bacterium]|nr:DNA-directed RNA polymerase subunit alpha [Fimbriimonadaceae bacterium]HRJ33484.1 DNA-directed RNA polymerase subunit alpha [Fimbriimonadaceae bacterium]